MPWLTPDESETYVYRVLKVPGKFLSAVNGALLELTRYENWEQHGTLTPEESAYTMLLFFDYYSRSKYFVIGSIIPVATEVLPENMLLCDGSIHNRSDYPELWAVLNSSLKIDPDTFKTPDLRARFIVGEGEGVGLSEYIFGDTGGEEAIELTVGQLPEHTHLSPLHGHIDTGHIHATEISVTTIEDVSPGVPVPGTISTAGFTASASANISDTAVTIEETGNDEAHENRPPFYAVTFGIIAK
jgi:microcystin-dependent protein